MFYWPVSGGGFIHKKRKKMEFYDEHRAGKKLGQEKQGRPC